MLPEEQLDDLQLKGLRILQKKHGFRYGMDSVLLADFAGVRARDHVADFGTGTGILPLLLLGRGKGMQFDAFEIQTEMAEMAVRSMELNGLVNTVKVHAKPVEQVLQVLQPNSMDYVIANPPYGMTGNVLLNPSDTLRTARHLEKESLQQWFSMGHRILKGKGRMAVVYPAPRMLELLEMMQKAHLEPKRLRLIYPREDKPANLCLVQAMKDGRPMLQVEAPLIVYKRDGSQTDELKRIYGVQEEC